MGREMKGRMHYRRILDEIPAMESKRKALRRTDKLPCVSATGSVEYLSACGFRHVVSGERSGRKESDIPQNVMNYK